MKTIARLGATTVATVTLTAAIAGCSSGSSESSSAATVASTVTPPSTASSAPAATPVASPPLSDFVEDAPTPGQYPPTPPSYSFGTPSGQIQCRVVAGNLPCQTSGRPHTVAVSALCGFYPGEEQSRAVQFGYFKDEPNPCATIIQGDGFHSPHTLAYGQTVTAELSPGLTVACSSAVDGLTCTKAGGTGARGFFLSADSFTVL